jgi:hypothetical protein
VNRNDNKNIKRSPKPKSERPMLLVSPSERVTFNDQPQGNFEDHYTEGKPVSKRNYVI